MVVNRFCDVYTNVYRFYIHTYLRATYPTSHDLIKVSEMSFLAIFSLMNDSGQIIATSHDLTLNGSKGNPLISGKPRLVKYYSIWPDDCNLLVSNVGLITNPYLTTMSPRGISTWHYCARRTWRFWNGWTSYRQEARCLRFQYFILPRSLPWNLKMMVSKRSLGTSFQVPC